MAARKKGKATKNPAKKKPGKRGMPSFVPSDEQRKQVELLAGLGLTHEQIASIIISPRTGRGIDRTTLDKHFREELASGKPKAHAAVAQSLFRKATSEDHPNAVTAAIWFSKAQMGWRERQQHDVTVESKSGVLVAPAVVAPDEWIAAQKKREGDG